MSVQPVSARVHVWFPTESVAREGRVNRGHAALYLGDERVGARFELSLDPASPVYRPPSAAELRDGRLKSRAASRRSASSSVQNSPVLEPKIPHAADLVMHDAVPALTLPPATPDAEEPGWDLMEDAEADLLDMPGVRPNDNYVSWWPLMQGHEARLSGFGAAAASPASGRYFDDAQEEAAPHVSYDLFGLDLPRMRACWHALRDDPRRGYAVLTRNCADIALRVLRQGGVFEQLGVAQSVWNGSKLLRAGFATRPAHVAMLCEALYRAGHATRVIAPHCPHPAQQPNLLRQLRGW